MHRKFNQIKWLNYNEVFNPVVNFFIIRLFFTIFTCLFKWLSADRDVRAFIGGYILFFGGTPISWRTFKQKFIHFSTKEAVYVTLTETAEELVWIMNVLQNRMKFLAIVNCFLIIRHHFFFFKFTFWEPMYTAHSYKISFFEKSCLWENFWFKICTK